MPGESGVSSFGPIRPESRAAHRRAVDAAHHRHKNLKPRCIDGQAARRTAQEARAKGRPLVSPRGAITRSNPARHRDVGSLAGHVSPGIRRSPVKPWSKNQRDWDTSSECSDTSGYSVGSSRGSSGAQSPPALVSPRSSSSPSITSLEEFPPLSPIDTTARSEWDYVYDVESYRSESPWPATGSTGSNASEVASDVEQPIVRSRAEHRRALRASHWHGPKGPKSKRADRTPRHQKYRPSRQDYLAELEFLSQRSEESVHTKPSRYVSIASRSQHVPPDQRVRFSDERIMTDPRSNERFSRILRETRAPQTPDVVHPRALPKPARRKRRKYYPPKNSQPKGAAQGSQRAKNKGAIADPAPRSRSQRQVGQVATVVPRMRSAQPSAVRPMSGRKSILGPGPIERLRAPVAKKETKQVWRKTGYQIPSRIEADPVDRSAEKASVFIASGKNDVREGLSILLGLRNAIRINRFNPGGAIIAFDRVLSKIDEQLDSKRVISLYDFLLHTLMVDYEFLKGTRQFKELRVSVQRMLSTRLNRLKTILKRRAALIDKSFYENLIFSMNKSKIFRALEQQVREMQQELNFHRKID